MAQGRNLICVSQCVNDLYDSVKPTSILQRGGIPTSSYCVRPKTLLRQFSRILGGDDCSTGLEEGEYHDAPKYPGQLQDFFDLKFLVLFRQLFTRCRVRNRSKSVVCDLVELIKDDCHEIGEEIPSEKTLVNRHSTETRRIELPAPRPKWWVMTGDLHEDCNPEDPSEVTSVLHKDQQFVSPCLVRLAYLRDDISTRLANERPDFPDPEFQPQSRCKSTAGREPRRKDLILRNLRGDVTKSGNNSSSYHKAE